MRSILCLSLLLNWLVSSSSYAVDMAEVRLDKINCGSESSRFSFAADSDPHLEILFNLSFYLKVRNQLKLQHRPPDGHNSGIYFGLRDIDSNCVMIPNDVTCTFHEQSIEGNFPGDSVFGHDVIVLKSFSAVISPEDNLVTFSLGLQKDNHQTVVEIKSTLDKCEY